MTSGLGLELGVYRRDRTQTKRVGRSEEIQFQTRGTNTFVLGFSMASQSLSHVKKKRKKKPNRPTAYINMAAYRICDLALM